MIQRNTTSGQCWDEIKL